jgi:hypothetical protein
MKTSTILAMAKARQFEAKFEHPKRMEPQSENTEHDAHVMARR